MALDPEAASVILDDDDRHGGMKMTRILPSLFVACIMVLACSGDPADNGDGGSTDTDSDTDSDADSDADSGVDTDCSGDGICNDPPDNFCSDDGTNLAEYTGEAACIDGVCNYSYETVTCEWGTCVYDDDDLAYCTSPCDEMVCTCDQFDDECTVDAGGYVELEVCINSGCTIDTEGNAFCYFDTSMDGCGLTSLGAACIDNPDGDDTCIED